MNENSKVIYVNILDDAYPLKIYSEDIGKENTSSKSFYAQKGDGKNIHFALLDSDFIFISISFLL